MCLRLPRIIPSSSGCIPASSLRVGKLTIKWHHQMETFSALLALCVGNSPVTSEFPSQGRVTSFDVLFDLCLKNGWANNCEAGGLRPHLAHYDDTVMIILMAQCKTALSNVLAMEILQCCSKPSTFYPSALRAGGVLSSRFGRAGGRPGGRLPNLRNPYLCNRLTDFLHSKFYGIV